ncbi:hypothetical protein [Burkholderia sp. BCC1999]|uniref:hypothetical protein n=1 Tax=Burkholderia sp. BCC1999 TaxID=2817448 RepID=UPI002AC334CA|nr:hypothetical protein [Burkholderia sp. BCC1999]
MQPVDSIFSEIRQILGVDEDSAQQTTTSEILTLPWNNETATWLSALRANDLHIPWSAEELRLFGNKASLENGQIGYRIDSTGRRLPNWPDDWVALGEISGDPIIGRVGADGCVILFARHGSGAWQANPVSNDTKAFAEALRIWCDLFVRRYSKDIYDDTLAVRPDFLAELQQRVNQTLSNTQTDVFMSMVDG